MEKHLKVIYALLIVGFLSITVQLWIQTKAINDLNEKMESVRELLFRFAWLISQVKKSNLISLFQIIFNNLASYPSGLRDRFAKPLFAGSNPADASTSARVVELVDTLDLKSNGWISSAGSSPAPVTINCKFIEWARWKF